jgi:hypothetical protein
MGLNKGSPSAASTSTKFSCLGHDTAGALEYWIVKYHWTEIHCTISRYLRKGLE